MLDNNSPIPLYYQLKSYIEVQITSHAWKPGDQIPSESELSDQFKVSRTTVRQAIGELVNQGKLTRTQGRGTFVTQYSLEKPIFRLTGFTQDMQLRGLQANSRVLKLETFSPPEYIAHYLNLKENEPVIMLKRLRKADNEIMAIDVCYLPFNRYVAILHEDLENSSLYEILVKKFSTTPTRSVRSLEAIPCPATEAGTLNVAIGAPVLYIVSTNYDQNDLPFEHAESYYRGDRFTFNVEILKQHNKDLT